MSESASSSVNPPVIRDLYISWSRTADSSRADKPSKPCKFSILKKLSEATDSRYFLAASANQRGYLAKEIATFDHISGVRVSGKYPPAPPRSIGSSGNLSLTFLAAATYPATE